MTITQAMTLGNLSVSFLHGIPIWGAEPPLSENHDPVQLESLVLTTEDGPAVSDAIVKLRDQVFMKV